MANMPALDELIKEALKQEMTPREIWEQRISFAFGNLKLSNDRTTRENIERVAIEIYGPRPD